MTPPPRRLIAALLLATRALALVPHCSQRRRPAPSTRHASSDDAADVNDADADADDEATLFSKRKAAEIKIPVEVYDTTPPQNLVGVYTL